MRFIRHQHFRSLARQFAVAVLTLCAATTGRSGWGRDGVWRETGVVNLSPFEFLNRLADHCAAANSLIFSASAAFVELA